MALQGLKVGTRTLIRNSRRHGHKGDKLEQRFVGPLQSSGILGKGAYHLQNAKTGGTI